MSFGEKLRKARMDKKMTTSEVAAATRVLVQIIEDLEREDFHRIAAPIYAKGFIRMYAAEVGLDPKPLIEEYIARFVSPELPLLDIKPDIISTDFPEETISGNAEPVRKTVRKMKEQEDDNVETEPSLFDRILKTSQDYLTGRRQAPAREKILEPVMSVPDAPESQEVQGEAQAAPKEQEEPDLFSGIERGNINLGSREEERAPAVNSVYVENAFEKLNKRVASICMECHKTLIWRLRNMWVKTRKYVSELPKTEATVFPVKYISVAIGILILLIFIFSSMYSWRGREKTETVVTSVETTKGLRVAIAPPDAYLK